ncbi:MAG: metal ABC transporter permease [Gemmatimonadales bacterium]|nr:MAG: metal ABC transporter permease [Gemmatimonadales bacterium]
MTSQDWEVLVLAVVVAVTCALPGVYLVLRRMALLSDAISHSILLGIVLAFFWVRDLNSPVLVLAAGATGVLMVAMVEALHRTRLVKEDAAIALVFPALFSLAVLLISRHAGDVHLDVDAVLLGEIAFAPFRRWVVGGIDLGPRALWMMLGILAANLLFLLSLHKEMKVATFDAGLAAAMGFSPVLLHYAFMSLVSVTAVGAFDAVGSILVVALMIAPPAAARLLTDRLGLLLPLAAGIAAGSAALGFFGAILLDASIAGSMASAAGLVFAGVLLGAPERGIVAEVRRRREQRLEFAVRMLLIHLLNHEGGPREAEENRADHLAGHLRWSRDFARRVVRRAVREGQLERRGGEGLALTPLGREVARHVMTR